MKKLILTSTLVILFSIQAFNQNATIQFLDINNVKAGILTHGDMFWNIDSQKASYEFPKGSGKQCGFASSLWIAGYDQSTTTLKVAAQTYRQTGNDYWPGPIDATNPIDSITSSKWDKIWKINQSDISTFLATSPHTVANTPSSILDWPAKGNIYAKDKNGQPLPINKKMAPFFDSNNDSIYNPLDGDYPLIKGQQALWWVFNDQRPHDETGSSALNLEIKAMAYACNSTSTLNNTTFYSFDITNYNSSAFSQTRMGIWDDMDLGYAFDDYIGVDTTRRLGYAYNGDHLDEGPNNYGSNLTISGLLLLHTPQDSLSYKAPLGAFTFYNNSLGPTGNPSLAAHYHELLNGHWKDGVPYRTSCNARDTNGAITNFVFTGNPASTATWTERNCNNLPDDRRFIISTSDFTFYPGEEKNFTFAVINTPLDTNHCCITTLQAMADTIVNYPLACINVSPTSVEKTILSKSLKLFPNPAKDEITLTWSEDYEGGSLSFDIVNSLGEKLILPCDKSNFRIRFDISSITTGIYFIKIKTDRESNTIRFLKQ